MEIKCRIWDAQDNKTHYPGDKTEDNTAFLLNMFGDVLEARKLDRHNADPVGKAYEHSIYPARIGHSPTPLLYINANDMNGKEIYEGDVVINHHAIFHISGIVTFNDGSFAVKTTAKPDYLTLSANSPFTWSQVEVIGNIYENPELLKEQTP
jgi:hypothetical protein